MGTQIIFFIKLKEIITSEKDNIKEVISINNENGSLLEKIQYSEANRSARQILLNKRTS